MNQSGNQWHLKANNSNSPKDTLFINYIADLPSLKSIALVAVAVRLWGYPHWEEFLEYPNEEEDCPEQLEKVVEVVSEKLNQIDLPKLIKQEVITIIRPIYLQWVNFFAGREASYYSMYYSDLHELYEQKGSSYWTMEGILNQVRLHKDIINSFKNLNNENIDFRILYENASYYCLEEHISDLWLKISSKNNINADNFANNNYFQHIDVYWAALLNNELPSLLTILERYDDDNIYNINLGICENMISSCVAAGNLVALKYFWHKLTDQEKNANIERWIRIVVETLEKEYFNSWNADYFESYVDDYIDLYSFIYQESNTHVGVMCFLLSHLMTQTKQEEIFQTNAQIILHSLFYHWPLQNFFLPTITVMLDSLQESIYVEIMTKITHSISKFGKELLLRQVWNLSPLNLKKAFIQSQEIRSTVIPLLLNVDDDKTVDLILNHASAAEKKMMTFGMIEESVFREFLYSKDSAVLAIDKLLSKTLSSDRIRDKFKQNVMQMCALTFSQDWILKADFVSLNTFWEWACSGETNEYKKTCIDLMDVYKSLILLGNYKLVSDFLNWYFKTEEEIFNFKKSFVSVYNFQVESLLYSLSGKGVSGWELFEKFLNYSFDSSVEIAQFKKVCVNYTGFLWVNNEFSTLYKKWLLHS